MGNGLLYAQVPSESPKIRDSRPVSRESDAMEGVGRGSKGEGRGRTETIERMTQKRIKRSAQRQDGTPERLIKWAFPGSIYVRWL